MSPADVARLLVGIARYDFWEEHCSPPAVVNCYILVAWAYAQCGIWVPRTLYGQLYAGSPVNLHEAYDGHCLVFTRGNWGHGGHIDNQRAVERVGHVGLVSSRGTVIHASSRAGTVIEEPLERLVSDTRVFRGIYRIP